MPARRNKGSKALTNNICADKRPAAAGSMEGNRFLFCQVCFICEPTYIVHTALHCPFHSWQVLKADTHLIFRTQRITATFSFVPSTRHRSLPSTSSQFTSSTLASITWPRNGLRLPLRIIAPGLTRHHRRVTATDIISAGAVRPFQCAQQSDANVHRMASIEGIHLCTGTAEIAATFWTFLELQPA